MIRNSFQQIPSQIPCKITKLQEYTLVSLSYCTLTVQASRSCPERKLLSSDLQTSSNLQLLPRT